MCMSACACVSECICCVHVFHVCMHVFKCIPIWISGAALTSKVQRRPAWSIFILRNRTHVDVVRHIFYITVRESEASILP